MKFAPNEMRKEFISDTSLSNSMMGRPGVTFDELEGWYLGTNSVVNRLSSSVCDLFYDSTSIQSLTSMYSLVRPPPGGATGELPGTERTPHDTALLFWTQI